MIKLIFLPSQTEFEAAQETKILAAANRSKTPIRYGCASCQCGTCGVKVSGDGVLSLMSEAESALLSRLGLSTEGDVRLACQARILTGTISVDIDFQDSYDPGSAAPVPGADGN